LNPSTTKEHHMPSPLLHLSLAGLALAFLPAPLPAQNAAPGGSGNRVAEVTRQAVSSDQVPEGLTQSEWTGIRAAHEAARYAVQPEGTGWQAGNPGQGWQIRFDGRGFTVRPGSSDWTWGLELKAYGFAGAEQSVAHPERIHADGRRGAYDWSETLTEWYENTARGLEHGFTVKERPVGPESNEEKGPLTFTLAVRGGLRPQVTDDGRGVHFVDDQGALALTYGGLLVTDAKGETLQAHFETGSKELRLLVDERGAQYPLTIDPLAQEAYLKASNTDANDGFGIRVAISGDTVVVGAYFEDSSATGINGNQNDNSAADSGAAYVFIRDPLTGIWSQEAYLKASNTDAGDQFGQMVAISGDTVVVGASREDSSATGVNGNQNDNSAQLAGAAYVFVRNGGVWAQEAYLKASNNDAGDLFGNSVAIWGATVVVGSRGEDSGATGVNGNQADNSASFSGAAYVFVRNGGVWSQQAYLKASNTNANDAFGGPLAISADTIMVGATGEDSSATGVNGNQANNTASASGAAYVFVRISGVWAQDAYLKASNTDAADSFGSSVAFSAATGVGISPATVVVGAIGEDSSATGVNGNQADNSAGNAGAAYVFVRNGGVWSQEAYLKASNTDAVDTFGYSVAISGDTVVVGAVGEGSSASGVNGNQADNSASASGAAYLFVRNGGIWSQEAYLKASNTGGADLFGISVAISANTVVVGARNEASSATGVNGNQADNSAAQAGAAYVFGPQILTASSEIFSVSAGGTINYTIDFPTVDAGRKYGMLLSVHGTGPTLLKGVLLVPLTADSFFAASAQGNTPPQGVNFQGTLDAFGDASAQFTAGAGSLPPKVIGHTLYLAVVNKSLDVSSKVRRIDFTP